ncbi:tRNA pseudouridine synthase A [Candidatus Karelsulcia muelleri]|uniref:tRNA pseudouridine synthase A n=1 Tax=Candidatus Karelsulcia muelleri TaxID=336810 RepID=A0A654MFW2_9FLAO|nr:tRNA pseudouridine(38-40) synthase TruA [Candidatus Karelsulcia muelleri]AGS33333.1 tRNA pseudouridine synthase A [Candidatus Karelsulcia muelleri str. Sulcia-ALF]ALP70263.1 tRNA pseudouridine synthase A [Candidatus Karelsulcia muelleri]QND78320.1 tRNA pseudouridine synthase A [Candidatus Karelsulcia muelleri]
MKFFLEITYHGASFYGWQIQKKNISVQETIENCLSFLLKKSIKIIGAGRTDTGVHAIQMFAHFDFYEKTILLYRNILFKLNSFLPLNIKIINIFPVKKTIHARFTAISRVYEYRISLGKNPFYLDRSWQWLSKKKIKLNTLNKGAKILKRYKNYISFCKTNCNYNICHIYNAKWYIKNKILYFNIEANRYLRNMIRSIVGTIIELGIGKITIKDFINIFYAKDRNLAGISAPAKGLFLTKINYPLNINLI